MDCRNYLGALMISKKYIAKEPEMDKYFYMRVINAIDPDRYKKSKLTFKILSSLERLKPAFKASLGTLAVFVAVALLITAEFLTISATGLPKAAITAPIPVKQQT